MSDKLTLNINLNKVFKEAANMTIDSEIPKENIVGEFDSPQEAAKYFGELLSRALTDFDLSYNNNLDFFISKEIVRQLAEQSEFFNPDDFT